MHEAEPRLDYQISPPLDNAALNELFGAAWPDHTPRDFAPLLARSLAYICAYQNLRLAGFVNLAWDGGFHAFLLDTTVHPTLQRRGIGLALVQHALAAASQHGVSWVHVDYEPHLRGFYARCGFQPTEAGLVRLG